MSVVWLTYLQQKKTKLSLSKSLLKWYLKNSSKLKLSLHSFWKKITFFFILIINAPTGPYFIITEQKNKLFANTYIM